MSFGAKLARGVLMGLSGYYGEQAKLQAEERKLAILADRESARTSFQRRPAGGAAPEEPDATYQRILAESYEHPTTKDLGPAEREAKVRELVRSIGSSVQKRF